MNKTTEQLAKRLRDMYHRSVTGWEQETPAYREKWLGIARVAQQECAVSDDLREALDELGDLAKLPSTGWGIHAIVTGERAEDEPRYVRLHAAFEAARTGGKVAASGMASVKMHGFPSPDEPCVRCGQTPEAVARTNVECVNKPAAETCPKCKRPFWSENQERSGVAAKSMCYRRGGQPSAVTECDILAAELDICPKCKRVNGKRDGVMVDPPDGDKPRKFCWVAAWRPDGLAKWMSDDCERVAASLNECPKCHRRHGTDAIAESQGGSHSSEYCWVRWYSASPEDIYKRGASESCDMTATVRREKSECPKCHRPKATSMGVFDNASTHCMAEAFPSTQGMCDRAAKEWEARQPKPEKRMLMVEWRCPTHGTVTTLPHGMTLAECPKCVIADKPLAPGEVVQLKSGGPKMTIGSIDEDGDACCTWFDKQEIPHEYTGEICMFVRVTP